MSETKATEAKAKANQKPEELQPLSEITDIENAIEAILFAAGYPVEYIKLSAVIGLSVKDIKNIVEHLSKNRFQGHGIQLLMYPDTCQVCTKEDYAPYIREALGIRRGGNLSNSSMEVLAIVAYNQPVTRAYIDTIRGVDSSYHVTSLLDKNLIEAVGRLEAPGRPILYGTTDKFLRVFGLNSLEELPETEALNTAETAAKTKADSESTDATSDDQNQDQPQADNE